MARFREHVHAYNERHRADPAAVRAWVAPLLARAGRVGPIPPAGSPAWQDLPGDDPRKPAALAQAALAWVQESTPAAIAARLAAELDQIDAAILARQHAVSADVSTAWGDQARFCHGPSHLELELRRARPSPDYHGTLAPHEIDRINQLTRAVWLCHELLLDPTVSVRDAQARALTDAARTDPSPVAGRDTRPAV